MSRAFLSCLTGIAVTILSWYGPWAWPAWPAFAVLDLVFGAGEGYHELQPAGRAAVIVGLIVVNVGFWAAIAFAASRLLRALAADR